MHLSSNFNTVQTFANGVATIAGTSVPPEGGKAIFRGVVVQQGALVRHGRALGGKDWDVEITAAFDPSQDALAIGTETYVFEGPGVKVPSFATFNWAQRITFAP